MADAESRHSEVRPAGARVEKRPPSLHLPPVIGHRGAAARAPENTLAGLRRAKELGCEWVEFDARLTGDGVPVLCHDPKLERTTDGYGPIASLPFAAIRRFDAGRRFDLSFAGEPVPTLQEALLLCAELGLGANIEMKADSRGQDDAIGRVVKATIEALRDRIGPVLVSSFQPASIAALCRSRPAIPLGILFRVVPRDWKDLVQRWECRVIGADHRRLRAACVAEMREAGYQVAAYTVNDPARARLLYGWGVTSVFSDVPDIIIEAGAGHREAQPASIMRRGAALLRQGAFW